jgi:hypothetical protein
MHTFEDYARVILRKHIGIKQCDDVRVLDGMEAGSNDNKFYLSVLYEMEQKGLIELRRGHEPDPDRILRSGIPFVSVTACSSLAPTLSSTTSER